MSVTAQSPRSASRATAQKPAAPGGMPLVAGALLPLAFMGAGLACAAMAAVLFACAPAILLRPHADSAVLTLTHLWLPGFLLSICLGAVYQLMPVVLGQALRGERVVWAHLWLHVGGLPLLIGGFWFNRFVVVSIGGTLIGLGVVLFFITTLRTFFASPRRDATGWSFVFSAGWLLLTVSAGVILAHNRFYPILDMATPVLLRAHVHLGLVGFFLTLLQSVTFQLMPMFMLAEQRFAYVADLGVTAMQTGMLFLIPGLARADRHITGAGIILICLGLACAARPFVGTLRSRRKRKLEPGLLAFVVGVALVPMLAALGFTNYFFGETLAANFPWLEFLETPRAETAYIVIAAAGVFGLSVPGMLCKILPFLVWMRVYGPRVGREAVPPAHTLGRSAWERAWFVLHAIGLVLLVVGVCAELPMIVRIGAWTLCAGAAFYFGTMLRVVRHVWHPQFSKKQTT